MSRKIDMTKKLSREDREYLLRNGRDAEVQANDAEFGGGGNEMTSEEREARISELRSELARLEQEKTTAENPNVANPETVPGGNVQDNTVVDDQKPAGATPDTSDDYDDTKKWTKAALSEELGKRNEERSENSLPLLRVAGTRSELVEELRRDDKELSEES